MDASLDAYKILGVPKDADPSALRAAYLRMARTVSVYLMQYHPDKAAHKDTQELFRSINAAYETLRDASSRFAYDARRKAYVASDGAKKGPRIAETIDIDAFDVQSDRDEVQLTYPCRCGQQFVVAASEMARHMDTNSTHGFDVQCMGCSEVVRVIYSED